MLKAVVSNILFVTSSSLGKEIDNIFAHRQEQKQVIVTN